MLIGAERFLELTLMGEISVKQVQVYSVQHLVQNWLHGTSKSVRNHGDHFLWSLGALETKMQIEI